MLCREAGGQAPTEGVRDERRLLSTGLTEERCEPFGEGRTVQPGDRLRLPQTGKVGNDEAVPLGKT